MKKLLISFSLVATLGASAATFVPDVQNFINNGTYLNLSNNMTWNYYSASNAYFYSYKYGTNVYAAQTNGNALAQAFDSAIVDVEVTPDANGDINPTYAIRIIQGVTTNFALSQYQSANQTAPFPSVNTASFSGTNAVGTNLVTLTFTPVTSDGYGNVIAAQFVPDEKTFAFSFNATTNNSQAVVITTNVPTTFLQGVTKIRLRSIAVSSISGSPGVCVDRIQLIGWKP